MKSGTIKEIAYRLGASCKSDQSFKGYSVDSRMLSSGNLFIALEGENSDGHQFLEEAAKRKAAGAVVSSSYDGESYGLPLIKVNKPLHALQTLAKNFVQGLKKTKIVGITGSVGKTSVKEMAATLLKAKYRVFSSQGNFNSQIGLPLTILNNIFGDEDVLVLEMGMSLTGEISRLIAIAPPTIALINNVEYVHAANFKDLRAISRAKGEILLHPKTELGILSYDIQNRMQLIGMGDCRKLTFSVVSPQADAYLSSDGPPFEGKIGETPVNLKHFPFKGRHNLHNFLAAATIAMQLGMGWEEILACIPFLKNPSLRQESVHAKGITVINDAYNASEVSMKAAFDCLPDPVPGGKKWALVGEMHELGPYSKEAHENVGKYALDHIDGLFCLGEECLPMVEIWKNKGKPVKWSSNRDDLVNVLLNVVKPGDVVLLKGANSLRLWEVIQEIKSKR